jgi:hypothetical protein
VLRAAGETETTQENIQDWLQLDEGNSGLQLLAEEEIASVTYFLLFIFINTTYIMSQDGVVGIATGYGLDDRRV